MASIRSGDDLREAGLHWSGAAFAVGQLQTQSRHPLQNRDEGDFRLVLPQIRMEA